MGRSSCSRSRPRRGQQASTVESFGDRSLRDKRDARPGEHGLDEPIAGGAQPLELGALEGRHVDVAGELALDVDEALGQRFLVDRADDEQIDPPATTTLPTLLAGLAIASSYSENKKDDDRTSAWRYADRISPIRESLHAKVGMTRTSAYSWL